jgi:hypothetical protein
MGNLVALHLSAIGTLNYCSRAQSNFRENRLTAGFRFTGKSTSIGNSNGFRFDAALFKANPEFFGEVRATVLAPGQMLVSVVPTDEQPLSLQDEETNPVMQAFLGFLEAQMKAHPHLIEPVSAAQMAQIAALVEGVEPD